MASCLGFSSTYPYHQYPQNPTIRGRGDGRGSCISDTACHIGHRARFLMSSEISFRAIGVFSRLRISQSADFESRNDLDRSRRLVAGFGAATGTGQVEVRRRPRRRLSDWGCGLLYTAPPLLIIKYWAIRPYSASKRMCRWAPDPSLGSGEKSSR